MIEVAIIIGSTQPRTYEVGSAGGAVRITIADVHRKR